MAKMKRSAYATFLGIPQTSGQTTTYSWYLIGKDIEDMSMDMNGSFETTKNILDETSVTDEGYEPSVEVSPYYADPSDSVYEWLSDLAMNRKSGDDAKAQYMEVLIEDTSASSHKAWKEDCYVEIGSYGGDTNGVNIEYTIHPAGNRVKGTATIANKIPTFTEES